MKHKKIYRLCVFLLLAGVLASSCRKAQPGLMWDSLDSQTKYRITNIYQQSPTTVYASTGSRYTIGEVLKSTDGGETWTNLDSVSPKILNDIEFLNQDSGIAVGFNGKIHQTYDGGHTWSFQQSILWKALHDIEWIDHSVGLMVGGKGREEGLIGKTVDGGKSWQYKEFPFVLRGLAFPSATTGYAAGWGKVLKTTNAGESWQSTSAKGDQFMDLCFLNESTGYVVGFNGSIQKTTDAGKSWHTVKKGNHPFQKRDQLQAVSFVNPKTGYAVGRRGLILKTNDGGKNWIRYKSPGKTDFKTIHLFNEHRGLVGGNHGWLQEFLEKKK